MPWHTCTCTLFLARFSPRQDSPTLLELLNWGRNRIETKIKIQNPPKSKIQIRQNPKSIRDLRVTLLAILKGRILRFLSHCKLRYGNLEYTTILHTTEYTNITILGGFWILNKIQKGGFWILKSPKSKSKSKIHHGFGFCLATPDKVLIYK